MSALWSKGDNGAEQKIQAVIDVLGQVRDQRSKIRLEFDEHVTSLKDITANLIDFDASGVVLEISSLKTATQAFNNENLTCYFRIKDRQAQAREQFLAFDTRVLSVSLAGNGLVRFKTDFPQNLRPSQLRRGLRVKVSPANVPQLTVWPDFSGKTDLGKLTPVFGPKHLAARSFRVDNFSANGVRLQVSNALMHAAMPQPAKGSRHVISFATADKSGATPATFWVSAVLRNFFKDPMTGETGLGFEFVAEGAFDPKLGLVFRPLKFHEVSGLGKFVFKWNLDLCREGLDSD